MNSGTRVDYWRDTLAKRAFIGAKSLSASVGNYTHMQLWNPAASGKLLIVTNIETFMNTASSAAISGRSHNAVLGAIGTAYNKYLGEAAPVAGVYGENLAALTGTLMFYKESITEDYKNQFKLTDPIIIPEGIGLIMVCHTLNTGVNAIFEWIEV